MRLRNHSFLCANLSFARRSQKRRWSANRKHRKDISDTYYFNLAMLAMKCCALCIAHDFSKCRATAMFQGGLTKVPSWFHSQTSSQPQIAMPTSSGSGRDHPRSWWSLCLKFPKKFEEAGGTWMNWGHCLFSKYLWVWVPRGIHEVTYRLLSYDISLMVKACYTFLLYVITCCCYIHSIRNKVLL